MIEPWLDKRGLAAHLSCGVRTVERALADGMPHVVIFGRVKFRVSEVEPWLEARGHLSRTSAGLDGRGQIPGQIGFDDDGAAKLVEPVTRRPGGDVNAPGPDIRR